MISMVLSPCPTEPQNTSSITLHPEVAKPFDLPCLLNLYCNSNSYISLMTKASVLASKSLTLRKITEMSRILSLNGLCAITINSNICALKHKIHSNIQHVITLKINFSIIRFSSSLTQRNRDNIFIVKYEYLCILCKE